MNDLTPFKKVRKDGLLAELGIKAESVEVTPKDISDALGRAGEMIRRRYGEKQFQNELGQKIREDLKTAFSGGVLTVVDKGLIVMASGFGSSLVVQVGFTGEPMKVCVLDGKTRFLTGIGLHLLQGES